MIKDTIKLTVITLVAGFLLGTVYNITKGPIELQNENAVKEAYLAVFEGADSFEEVEDLSSATAYLSAQGIDYATITGEVKALDASGNQIGTILLVTSKEGYSGDISIAMGVTNEGTLNGISILSISETAGLGMQAEDVLVPQFANKTVSAFTYTKTGATSDSQIDAISGATVTTSAFTNMVNVGLAYLESVREGE